MDSNNSIYFNIFNIECDDSFERHIVFNQNSFKEIDIESLNDIRFEILKQINYDEFEDEFKNHIEENIIQIKRLYKGIESIEEYEKFNFLFNKLKQNINKKKIENQIHSRYIKLCYNELRLLKNELNKKKRKLNIISEPISNRLKNITTTKFILNNEIYLSTFKLRKDLIKYRLIDKRQSSTIIHSIFRGAEINKKINWIGTKGELGLFIKLLKKYKFILNLNPYVIAKNAFTIDNKTIINLRDPKKKESNHYFEKIEKIVINFKS